MLGDTLSCSGQRVSTDRAQGGTLAWTALNPSPMFRTNHTVRKMNSVFGANQSLRSVLNPWVRKVWKPKGMISMDRCVAEATDSPQTKKLTERSLGKSMRARSLKYLRDISVGRQKQGIKPQQLVAQPLSPKIFVFPSW